MAIPQLVEQPAVPARPVVVTLTVPALPEFVRTVRITSAALASGVGFTFDEVDDVRVEIDQLCMGLMTEDRIGSLVVQFELLDGEIVVAGNVSHPTVPTPDPVFRTRICRA